MKATYDLKEEWVEDVKAEGCEITFWGHGSACAVHPESGAICGEWVAQFDCCNGDHPNGWLKDPALTEER